MASKEEAESRGWQVGKSLADCLRHMLDNHVACDVTFDVQYTGKPHVKMPAHKLMLQARSTVFEAMFSGAFVEADGNVVITDMEPTPFKDVLRYIYTDEIALTGDNVLPLLYAGEKYFLDNLAIKCRKFLGDNISVDNVCLILTHNLIQQDETLVSTCLDFIAHNTKAVLATEAFYEMSHDALLKVVSCDQLAHGVEADLFVACIEWGKRKVPDTKNPTDDEIRDILGTECLHKIRFPYITLKDFGEKFGDTSVLTGEEKSLIYSLLLTQKESYSNALCEFGFDVGSRMIRAQRYKHHAVQVYEGNVLSEFDSREVFSFTVNKPIQLIGFSVHGGTKNSEHDVKISVRNTTEIGKPCVRTEQKIRAAENHRPIPVYFRKTPISVYTQYEVWICIKGPGKTAYSWKPITNVAKGSLTITSSFIRHPLQIMCDRLQGASFVAELLFQLLPSP